MENKINVVNKRPKDYHCNCKYCKKIQGELLQENGKYYSARDRKGYSDFEKKNKHICKGHWHGFQWAIENFSKPGDSVLDPFSGSGTALVEGLKLGRRVFGFELEFYKILKANVSLYRNGNYRIFEGDVRGLADKFLVDNSLNLIVTGPPYNRTGDKPERKNLATGEDKSFDYSNDDNFAFLEDENYYSDFKKLFLTLKKKLKRGGHFITIIKDPIRDKNPYLLHKNISNVLDELGMEFVGTWIHRHWPPTLFMSTYPKRFPDVKIPLYQTIVVFKKK